MSEVKIKRVHISGLNPEQCSVQDLHDRFKSFQLQVQEVYNWPPSKDGVGNVQNWCFVTLQGETGKIKRATEVLNGTIWKGSKLRIGTAKKEKWKQESTKVEEVADLDKEKKEKKRKSKRLESETVDQPVTSKQVEEGLWVSEIQACCKTLVLICVTLLQGWKKTPAGHLLRPLHLRPSHPLSLPSIERKDAEKKEKRKRKAGSARSLTRAKRVTIDPSRYGAVHMAGPILDDGTKGLAPGCEWTCEETEDGHVKWELKDEQGKVLRQEIIPLRKAEQMKEVTLDSDGDDDDDEDDSSMDEVAAAIDNAESESSSSDQEEEEEIRAEAQSAAPVEKMALSYNPGEESDFSEGYQEVQDGIPVRTKDWEEEKAGHFNLLKNMFGAEELPMKIDPPALMKPYSAEESEEEEEQQQQEDVEKVAEVAAPLTGAQKRAALLGAFTAGQQDAKSFQPMTRFDPGVDNANGEEADEEVEETNQVERVQEEEAAPSDTQAAREDRVQMSSLKDMFRPKEDSAGFTLLGDLDLDLEEELEEEEPEMDNRRVQITPPIQPVQRGTLSVKPPFFFPTSDKHDQSWFSLLSKDSNVLPFCKDKTDEEIQAQWKERKGQLTQDYKRRHREALKKKKRKYTGSRAAGTSIPLRF